MHSSSCSNHLRTSHPRRRRRRGGQEHGAGSIGREVGPNARGSGSRHSGGSGAGVDENALLGEGVVVVGQLRADAVHRGGGSECGLWIVEACGDRVWVHVVGHIGRGLLKKSEENKTLEELDGVGWCLAGARFGQHRNLSSTYLDSHAQSCITNKECIPGWPNFAFFDLSSRNIICWSFFKKSRDACHVEEREQRRTGGAIG